MSASADPDSAPRRLPVWAVVGIALAVLVLVILVAVLGVKALTQRPFVLLGSTPASELVPGACLEESALDAAVYTTTWCTSAHAQQVFATVDLTLDPSVLGADEGALFRYGDELCARYLEYSVYLSVDADDRAAYTARILGVPTRAAYDAGATDAVCAIAAADGASLSADLYQPMG